MRQKRLRLEQYIKTKIPRFEIREKNKTYQDDPWYRKPAEAIARLFCPTFDTDFATTMSPFIYVPSSWIKNDSLMYETERHEFIHLMDNQLNPIWFSVSYILLLPVILTMRSYWEYRGYSQNLIYDVESRGKVSEETIKWATENFTNSNYAWMDLRGEKRIRALAEKANRKEIKGFWPHEDPDFAP